MMIAISISIVNLYRRKRGEQMSKQIKNEATVTLLLREQDINLLIQSLRDYKPTKEEAKHNRDYLLDVLETIAMNN